MRECRAFSSRAKQYSACIRRWQGLTAPYTRAFPRVRCILMSPITKPTGSDGFPRSNVHRPRAVTLFFAIIAVERETPRFLQGKGAAVLRRSRRRGQFQSNRRNTTPPDESPNQEADMGKSKGLPARVNPNAARTFGRIQCKHIPGM